MDATGELSKYIITSVLIVVPGPRRPDGVVPEQFGAREHGVPGIVPRAQTACSSSVVASGSR
eukprot:7043090-Pyramimonas_sp.AAC.1